MSPSLPASSCGNLNDRCADDWGAQLSAHTLRHKITRLLYMTRAVEHQQRCSTALFISKWSKSLLLFNFSHADSDTVHIVAGERLNGVALEVGLDAGHIDAVALLEQFGNGIDALFRNGAVDFGCTRSGICISRERHLGLRTGASSRPRVQTPCVPPKP